MVCTAQFGSKLVTGLQNKLIVINYKTQECQVLELPAAPEQSKKNQTLTEVAKEDAKTITCMCISKSADLFGVTTNTKQILLYDEDFSLKHNFVLNRVASRIRFAENNDLVVADKTGDVFLYQSKKNYLEGELLLGHLSMLLDVLVTPCNKYIVTCDRDEKIRVSHYPNSYNILTYCLGHKEFVTNVELYNNTLISASGDGTIRLWNYFNGEQIDCMDTNQYVNDEILKSEFCKEMDGEKIDIDALPITNMVLMAAENKGIIVASLFKYDGLLVFEIDKDKVRFVQSLKFDAELISFSIDKLLIVLTKVCYLSYEFNFNDSMFVLKDCSYINNVYNDNKCLYDKACNSESITVLYKRKYDNVQEYLERKKQRLGGL